MPATINVISIESGTFLNEDDVRRMHGITPFKTIEHVQNFSPPEQIEVPTPPEPDPEPEPAPEPELSPAMKHAMALGYVPLPRRPHRVD